MKPGDVVTRNLCGVIMQMTVTAVDDKLIHCGPWTFDKNTGLEVDEEMSIPPFFPCRAVPTGGRPFMRTLIFVSLLSLTGCSDWTFGRDVSGKVASAPVSRIATEEGGGSFEKFSVKLSDYEADEKVKEVAGGPSGLLIECTSTRCGALQVGECHSFECKYEIRGSWLSCDSQPPVIHCKHLKEVACSAEAE